MKDVPRRTILSGTPISGVFVSKSVDRSVPQRLEGFDQYIFPKGNPNIVNHEVTNKKIGNIEIFGLLDGCGVLAQTFG